jgi:hypothetical protein
VEQRVEYARWLRVIRPGRVKGLWGRSSAGEHRALNPKDTGSIPVASTV